ncbi:MAG: hypothetical protein AVDCRST_MAG61-437, partial [uncultured Friedmanniella sp.]
DGFPRQQRRRAGGRSADSGKPASLAVGGAGVGAGGAGGRRERRHRLGSPAAGWSLVGGARFGVRRNSGRRGAEHRRGLRRPALVGCRRRLVAGGLQLASGL